MNAGTIPAKLILQLTTAFREGGFRDRSNTFFYKDHLHECFVPVLALAGDQDLICPPVAVEGTFSSLMWNIIFFSSLLYDIFQFLYGDLETAKLIPEHLVTYKCFGEPGGPHYAHYDLVGGRLV